MPPSTESRYTGAVSVPTCIVPPAIAPAMVEPCGTVCSVTSRPRFAKKPLSFATNAGMNAFAGV